MADTLGGIMARPDHRCVLAVSHGGACRAFMRYWEQNQKVELHTRLCNCCILKFEYEDGQFSLVGHRQPRLCRSAPGVSALTAGTLPPGHTTGR